MQRDRHAFYLTTIAVCGASLEKMATEIRALQRTDIREAEEYFAPGQKGSSAMPHKRNPITCEKICGLARVLRGNAQAALEMWHFGMNAIFPILPWNGLFCRTARFFWTICSAR